MIVGGDLVEREGFHFFRRVAARKEGSTRFDGTADLRTVFPRNRGVPQGLRRIFAAFVGCGKVLVTLRGIFPETFFIFLFAEFEVESFFVRIHNRNEFRHQFGFVRHKRTVALEIGNRFAHALIFATRFVRIKQVVG